MRQSNIDLFGSISWKNSEFWSIRAYSRGNILNGYKRYHSLNKFWEIVNEVGLVTSIARATRTTQLAVAAVFAATVLSGCANQTFRTAVGKFGAQTDAAMTAQSEALVAQRDKHQAQIRSDLAARRAELVLAPNCVTAIVDEEGLARIQPCTLLVLERRAAGTTVTTPVIEPITLDNVVALQEALAAYGRNLALLAADSSDDEAKFQTVVGNLGTSIGGLDKAVTNLTGSKRLASDNDLGVIAEVIAKFGTALFKQRRADALRQIISRTDGLVQDAVAAFGSVDTGLQLLDYNSAGRELDDAITAERLVVSDAASTAAQVREVHDAVFLARDRRNAIARQTSKIRQLGKVHSALSAAAQGDASSPAMTSALKELMQFNDQP